MINVPGNWKSALSGSSRLRDLCSACTRGSPLDEPYSFWAQQIQASSRIEVNGQTYPAMGQPAVRKELYRPMAVSYNVDYPCLRVSRICLC